MRSAGSPSASACRALSIAELDQRLAHHRVGIAAARAFAFSSISRARSSGSRLPQLTPMRTGLLVAHRLLDHHRELRIALAALADVARIDAVLGERLRALRELGQKLVTVEMEVADQRHGAVLRVQALADPGNRGRGLAVLTVMRTSSEPASASAMTCATVARRPRCRCWSSTGRRSARRRRSPRDPIGPAAFVDARGAGVPCELFERKARDVVARVRHEVDG